MATPLRRTNLAYVLIVACSSATPSTAPGPIQGVLVIEPLQCDGYCPEESVSGAALAQGALWVTRARDTSPDQGHTHVDDAQLGRATFGADGGVTILATAPTFTTTNFGSGLSSDVGVTTDGSKVYFAYEDRTASQVVVQEGVDGGPHLVTSQDAVVLGLAAQPQSAIVAAVPSCCGNGCQTPCFGGVGGGDTNFDVNSGSASVAATVYGINFADGGVTQQAIGIDAQASKHLFTTDDSNVYWIGGGMLWSMPVDFSAAPTSTKPVAGIPVGLSTAQNVVAWASVQGTSQCGSGPCTFTPKSYSVSTTTSGVIYQVQSTTQFCLGLAIDASNAYFAIVEQRTTSNCCNGDDGGLNYNTNVYTTGIARISLTGAPTQTPSVVAFDTDRMFGPRRFFVDDTYVYGIDPAYVLRIAKTAFP